MSYRAFKRLLGETSLERKSLFLFGGFTVLLIAGSFLLYAWLTERLAYEQINTASRLLVVHIINQRLNQACHPPGPQTARAAEDANRLTPALREFHKKWEDGWPGGMQEYKYSLLPAWGNRPDRMPDQASQQKLQLFRDNPRLTEDSQLVLSQKKNYYYGAVRATRGCVDCHRQHVADLNEGDLLAVIKIEAETDYIADAFHANRAYLLSTALVTVLAIMAGSYLIVRYVIVKPVKHLKEVSDAISAGELNVRSEIQTGDEFEDLSHAFNRMLRNLVAMQERLRKVNNDLDRKVDELAQANLALYESNRLKSDFLATMSHELRTPLHSILGFSDLLRGSAGLGDKQQRWAGNIHSSGEQLMNLISDILDLAKIEAGRMQVSLSTFDVTDACEGLLTMFRPMAEKKNIDLKAVYGPALPRLRQDMVKVQQIVSNLLSNAIKFTPEGGRVVLRAEADGGHVVLTVHDTGVGIAPEEQELVFEKFRQSGNLLTREHGGTGLGLSIVRELSKLLGGEVTLQSELGRGSTFTVRLPAQLSELPRLEFDLAHEGIDLSKAQRIDVRLYTGQAATRAEMAEPPSDGSATSEPRPSGSEEPLPAP